MNNLDLKRGFLQSLPSAAAGAEQEWQAIELKYADASRHYHTLKHLQEMYTALRDYYQRALPVASMLALVYHDLEYSVLRSDNEKRSAAYAEQRLKQWNLPGQLIAKVHRYITATQSHNTDSGDEELRAFLDADMAVLGSAPEAYADYTAGVRKEFSIYPDFIYNKGRRDFVSNTLARESIFFTAHFYNKYEQQARINLQNELNQLK